MNEKEIKELCSKLKLPTHYTYISRYILNKDDIQTKQELDILVSEGIIVKHPSFEDYYLNNEQ